MAYFNNEKTKKIVLWFHLEPYNRKLREIYMNNEIGAKSAVVISDNITGLYEYLYSLHPNGGN